MKSIHFAVSLCRKLRYAVARSGMLAQDKALVALERFDFGSRPARAERLVWLSQFQAMPGAVAGQLESLHLLEEARVSYVNGLYAAALLTATAAIEHFLVEELHGRVDGKDLETFAKSIGAARSVALLPVDVLDAVDKVRERRNPFSHKRAPEHRSTLPARMRAEGKHPHKLLQEDAQLAISTMYAVFFGTLGPFSAG